jgi:hypothetical protein
MSLFNTYRPFIIELSNVIDTELEKILFEIVFSNDISYPLLKLGHNHYNIQNLIRYNESLNKNEKSIENLKLIPENFSVVQIALREEKKTSIIDEVNNMIDKIDKKIPKIENNYFTQLWEIILYFDLLSSKNMSILNISDSKLYFTEACIVFRLFTDKKINNDYYSVIVNEETKNNLNDYVKKIIKKNNEKDGYDLITTEIYKVVGDERFSEQKIFEILINQIIEILTYQKNGGNLVFKMYDTYTYVSLRIIEFLKYFYEKVYVCKPFTSLTVNSERYLIFKKFIKKNMSDDIILNLKKILKKIEKNNEYKIQSLFENFEINEKKINEYKNISKNISIQQYLGINNYFNYINLDNKNGKEFNDILEKKDNSTEFWVSVFLDEKNFKNIIF